ncbi:MAG: hypothetical protein ACJAYU_002849 [Bradymonadia bacterium]|jgi:uncharacterized protein (DUF2132 family)
MTDSPQNPSNDPLHGITLRALLETLVFRYGWQGLAEHVRVGCFINDPSMKSSLKFLRKTPWARTKVEGLYLADIRADEKRKKRNAYKKLQRQSGEAEGGLADGVQAEVADESLT